MNPQSRNGNDEMGSLLLGLGLSVAVATCFLMFIALGAFFPQALSVPAFASHPASIGLVWGFGLILLSAATHPRLRSPGESGGKKGHAMRGASMRA